MLAPDRFCKRPPVRDEGVRVVTAPERQDGPKAEGRALSHFLLSAPEIENLPVETVRKGAWLFEAGDTADHVVAVLDGAAVLRKLNVSGESVAVDLATRGGTIGNRAFVGNRVHGVSAQCAVDSVVCRIPFENLDAALGADRRLEKAFLAQLATDLSATQERMLQVATLKVRDRLLILLARLARDFTTMNDQWALVVAPPISRIDMASLAGMTPESLSRCIRGIEAEGVAHFSRRHVVIRSTATFREELARIGVGMHEDASRGPSLAVAV